MEALYRRRMSGALSNFVVLMAASMRSMANYDAGNAFRFMQWAESELEVAKDYAAEIRAMSDVA